MLEYLLHLWPESLFTQTLLVGVVVGVVAWRLLKTRHRWPPGPPALPFIGNILSFYNTQWFQVLFKWSKQYGPIIDCKFGPKHLIVVSNIELALDAFMRSGSDITGKPTGPSGDVFTEGCKDIFQASYGPRWKLHRRIASKALRNYLQGESLSRELTKSMAVLSKALKSQTGPFDVFPFLTLTSFNLLSGMSFSKTSPDINDEHFQKVNGCLDTLTNTIFSFNIEDVIPVMKYCPTAKFKRFVKACDDLHDILRMEVDQHKKTLDPSKPRNFLDAMLIAQIEAAKDEDPEVLAQITDVHIRQTIQDIFFAGVDATRVTMYWCLLALALNPEVQKKVQEEVDSVIGADLAVDVKDRERLSYTEAVLHEVMRMRPGTPLGVPHETIRETTIGGYVIPTGTTVAMNVFALHFDPDYWDEPEVFRPERFLDDSGKMGPKPESWLPFSAGRRVCLGGPVAKPELHLLLAGMCRGFSFDLAPGTTHDFKPYSTGFQMRPKPFELVATART